MSDSIQVNGRAAYLFVPVTVIGLCSIGAPLYYSNVLSDFCVANAIKVVAIASAVETVLLTGVVFVASRRIVFEGRTVTYRSWFTHREIDVASILDMTLQSHASADSSPVDDCAVGRQRGIAAIESPPLGPKRTGRAFGPFGGNKSLHQCSP